MPGLYKIIISLAASAYATLATTFFSLLLFILPFIAIFMCSCNRNKTQPIIANESKNIDSTIETADASAFQYLPPVFSFQQNNDSATSIILTTADVARFDGKAEEKSYVNSVQIVDADQPWPPRWYTSTPIYTDEMFNSVTKNGEYRYDMESDAKIINGYFSFYKILSKQKMGTGQLIAPEFAAYILLNEKMEPVDTIRSNLKRSNVFFHDLRINDKGERMVDLKKDTYLDLRDYTDDPQDTAVHCNIDYIHILDSNNKTIFTWNPLHHINPDLFQYKETVKRKAFMANHSDMVEWTRLTSALWDYDGNILYAMKGIGIGKVSRETGQVIWQVNYSDIPLVTPAKDTLEWYSPHDFNLLSHNATTATYSLYSNGYENTKPACGVIFEVEKKTNQFRLVKYVMPQTKYFANGQGNLEYFPNGDYAIGYGFFEKSDTGKVSNYRNTLEYKLNDGNKGVYQLPQWIYTYKARLLRNWPRPPRPMILKKGDVLEASGGFKNYTWYKLSGNNLTTVTKVGTGITLKCEKRSIYCVEAKYGIGFSVSKIFKN